MNQKLRLLTCGTLALLLCVISSTANAAEIQLLGIKLGSHGMKILQKYGNPTEIRVGGVTVTGAQSNQPGIGGASQPGMMAGPGGARPGGARPGGLRPGGGGPGGMMRGDAGSSKSRLPKFVCSLFRLVSITAKTAAVQLFDTGSHVASFNGQTQGILMAADMGAGPMNRAGMMGMPPGMPGMSPAGRPAGMPGMPGMTGMPNGQNAQNAAPAGGADVVWVYKFTNDRVAEFSLNSDGIVWQISIHGVKWAGQKTQKNVVLGSMYRDVIRRYGYPENHEQRGIELLLHYNKRDRVVFTLVGRQVIGVTIALQ